MRRWRRRSAAAVIATIATIAAPTALPAASPAGAGSCASSAKLDTTATARLREAVREARRSLHREALFDNSGLRRLAKRGALRGANGCGTDTGVLVLTQPNVPADQLAQYVDSAIGYLLPYAATADPTVTDGGYAVAVRRHNGRADFSVAIDVGAPLSPFPALFGCTSSGGFCWQLGGLDPHLRWTRNVLRVYVSTDRLTRYRLAVAKAAIARIAKVKSLGADVQYGGTTAAIRPSAGHMFLMHWVTGFNGHCRSTATGCTSPYGPGVISQADITLRTTAWPNTRAHREEFIGVATHELGHAFGLGHYDYRYRNSYQLMNGQRLWVTTLQSGDRHGLATVAPPGIPGTSLTLASTAVPAGDRLKATVTTWSTGLGGVRRVELQCTDLAGGWHSVATASGTWDIRRAKHALSYQVPAETSAYEASCRSEIWTERRHALSDERSVMLGS